jgi:hypothetical protein
LVGDSCLSDPYTYNLKRGPVMTDSGTGQSSNNLEHNGRIATGQPTQRQLGRESTFTIHVHRNARHVNLPRQRNGEPAGEVHLACIRAHVHPKFMIARNNSTISGLAGYPTPH